MLRKLLVVDPVTRVDIARLEAETGRSAADWQRALAAPALARVVGGADSDDEAEAWLERLRNAGLNATTFTIEDARAALARPLEAASIVKSEGGLRVTTANGRSMLIRPTDVRMLVTGRQARTGKNEIFLVVVLAGPATVIVRAPGAPLEQLFPKAPTAMHALGELFLVLQQQAPHSVVERGLEQPGALLGAFHDELGVDDLAAGAALAAVLPPGIPAVLASPFGPPPAAAPPQRAPAPISVSFAAPSAQPRTPTPLSGASGADAPVAAPFPMSAAPLPRTPTPHARAAAAPAPGASLELDEVPRPKARVSSLAQELVVDDGAGDRVPPEPAQGNGGGGGWSPFSTSSGDANKVQTVGAFAGAPLAAGGEGVVGEARCLSCDRAIPAGALHYRINHRPRCVACARAEVPELFPGPARTRKQLLVLGMMLGLGVVGGGFAIGLFFAKQMKLASLAMFGVLSGLWAIYSRTALVDDRVAASMETVIDGKRQPFEVGHVGRILGRIDDVRIQKPRVFWGAAGGVAAVLLVLLLVTGKPPPLAREKLEEGDSWETPWGVVFEFADRFDATVGGIPVVGMTLVAHRKGQKESFRISGFEAEREREAFGVRFRILTFEEKGRWLKLEARAPVDRGAPDVTLD